MPYLSPKINTEALKWSAMILTETAFSSEENAVSVRIIADHLRASVFILGDKYGIAPSNTDQGYILRRLIRRAIRHGKKIGINNNFTDQIAKIYIEFYKDIYPELEEFSEKIVTELVKEEERFTKTLIHGEKEFEKILPNLLKNKEKILPGRLAFKLFDTY